MNALRRFPLGFVLGASLAVSLGAAGCLPEAAGRSQVPALSPSFSSIPSPSPGGPTPVPSFVRPTPTPMPTFLVYVVAKGDSLNSIAHRFSTTARSIAFWNRATYPSLDPDSETYAPNRIRVGWTLVLIPGLVVNEFDLPQPSPTPAATPAVTASPSPVAARQSSRG
jgi:hypothetical protein